MNHVQRELDMEIDIDYSGIDRHCEIPEEEKMYILKIKELLRQMAKNHSDLSPEELRSIRRAAELTDTLEQSICDKIVFLNEANTMMQENEKEIERILEELEWQLKS